jgi:hypothetical protein
VGRSPAYTTSVRVGWIGVATALVVAAVAGLARAASIGVEVTVAGPQAAEMSSWTELRVDLKNTGQDSAQAHVTLTVPEAGARPAGAEGAQCSGSTIVECVQTIPGGGSVTMTLPVRWQGTGSRSVEVKARMEAAGSTAEASASSNVTVYKPVLSDLKTSAARAGQSFVAAATLARSDTQAALEARSLRCSATVAKTPTGSAIAALKGKATVDGAHVTCSWRLPKSAHGRYVRALVLADTHAGGMLTKYPFLRRVR